jgi:hypothetical protein
MGRDGLEILGTNKSADQVTGAFQRVLYGLTNIVIVIHKVDKNLTH